MKKNKKQESEFTKLARPLMEYLAKNYHPHITVILTSTSAELLEGVCFTGIITDYVNQVDPIPDELKQKLIT